MPLTTADIGQQIKSVLSDKWSIHVDQIDSYQIPERPWRRVPKNVTTFRIFVSVYQPVYVSAFLSAPTLAALKKKVDAGELWEEIRKECEKKQMKWQQSQASDLLTTNQPRLPGQQLALTHTPDR